MPALGFLSAFVFCAQPIVDVASRFASSFLEQFVRTEGDSVLRGEFNTL